MFTQQVLNPIRWFVSTSCLACGQKATQDLCTRCQRGVLLEQRSQPVMVGLGGLKVWAWGTYHGVLERAMYQLKYEGAYGWGRVLGEMMARTWVEQKSDRTSWEVVPIPLDNEKLKTRGYNQAEEISYTFARRTGLSHRPDGLTRTRTTQPQWGLNPEQRAENIKGAFTASAGVKGKCILLVDDIYTTGSTVAEAVAALKAQGAIKVMAVIVARPLFNAKA